jgi:hypothetical protein
MFVEILIKFHKDGMKMLLKKLKRSNRFKQLFIKMNSISNNKASILFQMKTNLKQLSIELWEDLALLIEMANNHLRQERALKRKKQEILTPIQMFKKH